MTATLAYRRQRFSTRLPTGRLYTAAHYWLEGDPATRWRIGFTKFATRMLGDVVEYRFEVEAGGAIRIGQKIGWVEGFKAVTDLYSVVDGAFLCANPDLERDVTLVDGDPYARGWLYEARGLPEPQNVDALGYTAILDATIDKILEKPGGDADA